MKGLRLVVFRCFFTLCLLGAAGPGRGAEPANAFVQANSLYEQGKFKEAIQAYQQLIGAGQGTAAVYYNLGNACYKVGFNGRAIAAYREAQRLEPRDPNLRYNLDFVRKKATGFESAPFPFWKRFLMALTVDEWTRLAACGYWLFFGLLALREFRPAWKHALSGYTAAAGVAAALLAGFLWTADFQQNRAVYAVVTAPNAVLLWSPIEKSEKVCPAPDGTELTVLDMNNDKSWLQVQTAARQVGWIRSDQVVKLGNRFNLMRTEIGPDLPKKSS